MAYGSNRGKGKGKGKGKGRGKGKGKGKGKGNSRQIGSEYDKFKEEIKSLSLNQQSLTEEEVGITEYMNNTDGFSGLFRERFSDFIVNEVSPQGKVAVLSSANIPLNFDAANGFSEDRPLIEMSKEAEEVAVEMTEPSTTEKKITEKDTTGQDVSIDPEEVRRINFTKQCWENVAAGVESVFGGESGIMARKSIETIRDDEDKSIRVLLPPSSDKVIRKTCHQLIHDHIGHFVDADTIDDPNITTHDKSDVGDDLVASVDTKVSIGKCIRIWWRPSAGMKRKRMTGVSEGEKPRDYRSNTWQQRARHNWTEGCSPYIKFILYKENMDTMTAIERIASLLRIRSSDIGYAGTKDKRACTSQYCTLYKLPASKVASIVNETFLNSKGESGRQLLVGEFTYHETPLDLGDLGGNRFGITLRKLCQLNKKNNNQTIETEEIISSESKLSQQIEHACNSIDQSGFINFFGTQRFGSGGVCTADIGRAILRNEWEVAVNLVLAPRGGDHEDAVLAKHVYHSTKDARMALAVMPPWMKGEHAILCGLADGNSFKDSIRRIPHKLKLMYVHAYQSKLFNIAAGKRAKYGAPIEGDLVLVPDSQANIVEQGGGSGGGGSDVESHGKRRGQKGMAIHVVSAADVSEQAFTLSQVVLPLPGHDVQYPQFKHTETTSTSIVANQTETTTASVGFYDVLLQEDGLTQSDLKRNDEFSLSGDYRALVVKPIDLKWSLKSYTTSETVLLPSDGDHMKQALMSAEETSTLKEVSEEDPNAMADLTTETNDEELALCLEFTLPSSSYATVFLRELMKNPMCSSYHVSLGANNSTTPEIQPSETMEEARSE